MNDFDSEEVKRAFYPLDDFPEFKALTDHYAVIAKELENNIFWMSWGSDSYDPKGHCKFLDGAWTVCPVYFGDYSPDLIKIPGVSAPDLEKFVLELPMHFPETQKLLGNISGINFAAFSRLNPRSKLARHQHNNPLSLIFHMGLKIPAGKTCGLTVNDETHIWMKPGDAVIFDDTLLHSAWNDSDEERTILYIDFPRQKLTPEDRMMRLLRLMGGNP